MSAKNVGADSREERGRLGEQRSHRQPATEKRGRKNKTLHGKMH